MPNWCQNTLSIKGTKEQIVDFNKKYLPNEAFSFENIIPSPQTIRNVPKSISFTMRKRRTDTFFIGTRHTPKIGSIGMIGIAIIGGANGTLRQ